MNMRPETRAEREVATVMTTLLPRALTSIDWLMIALYKPDWLRVNFDTRA